MLATYEGLDSPRNPKKIDILLASETLNTSLLITQYQIRPHLLTTHEHSN